MTTTGTQKLLVYETKTEHEYNPVQALRVWRLLQPEVASEYGEHARSTDEDRIVLLFELLNGSIFGDLIFSDLANTDAGSTLIERAWDE